MRYKGKKVEIIKRQKLFTKETLWVRVLDDDSLIQVLEDELEDDIEMHIVPGSEINIKVTTVEDLEILKALMHTTKDEWLK